MSKTIIWIIAGVGLAAAAVGGMAWYWKRRKGAKDGPSPSKPPRDGINDDSDQPDRKPSDPDDRGRAKAPDFSYVEYDNLDPELAAEINAIVQEDNGWPPTQETIDTLETGDVIVYAVESKATGNFTETVQELISAQVLSVESTIVRGRVIGEMKHPAHFATTAGHGVEVGMAVDVPRKHILMAAKYKPKEGYDGHGRAAATFKSSHETKKVYKVRPGVPYDLILPYRTDELEWHVDPKSTKLIKVGEKGLYEQIMFPEDALRGDVTVRVLDNDPEHGYVMVARYDFDLDD